MCFGQFAPTGGTGCANGSMIVLRNTYSLADEEKYAWRGLTASLGTFLGTDASLLYAGLPCLPGVYFYLGPYTPPAVYASG
jgi:hypothetical protein